DADGSVLWYPPGRLAAGLTLLALAGMAAALVLMGGPDGLQSTLAGVVGHALDRLAAQPLQDRDAVAATIAGVVPGTIALSWMMMAVVNAILAQGLLVRFGVNWRPSPDLAALTLPSWLAILLGVAAAATLVGGAARFIGINVM